MKQEDKFIEKRDAMKRFVKINQVFSNTQLATKMYGQCTNGVKDVALTESEIRICKSDLNSLIGIVKEVINELP